MNKTIFLASAALLFFVPFSSHAAFSFTRISHNDSGGGYSVSPSTHPAYSEYFWGGTHTDASGNWLYDGIGLASSVSAACNGAVERSGLSDTEDTYCVYDSYLHEATYGSGDMGSGSGGTPSEGTFDVRITAVYVYQTSFQSRNVSQMIDALQSYYWNKALGFPATDPGYRDVCPLAHFDDVDGPDILGTTPVVCDIYHHDGVTVTKPIASLSASPASLVSGSSANLTYSCSNGATSASINNGVGTLSSPASGSKSVSPSTTTTYTLTCTNSAGSDTDTASVTVVPTLSASCSVNDTNIATGGSVTWTANPSGGTGSYSYSWSGTDSLSGTGKSVSKTYSSTGTKTASVKVTSGTQSKTVNCGNSVTVSNPPLSATCSVNPTSLTTGSSATWTANPSGGTGSYSYSWSGTDSLSGTSKTVSKTYSTTGTKTGTVKVTSGSESKTVNCSNSLSVSEAAKPDLTAGNIPASTHTPGSVSLASSISNTGNASTGSGFSVLFQKATNSSGSGASDLGYADTSALADGSSRSVSKSFSFTAGTFYVRACADKSSAGDSGDISESNEDNNCGDWTQLSVNAALSATCSVSPTSITTGGSATWTASPSGGTGSYSYVWSGDDSLSGSGSTVTKTYSSTGTKTGTVKVTSGSESKTVNCSNSLSVSEAAKPDLTAGKITPTSATEDTAVTLKAAISNNGGASTGASFTNLFQKANSSSGSGATDIGTASVSTLAASGSATASKSYTFSSSGTFYVRACADKSSAGDSGDISESNEDNNCGDWTKVTVGEASEPSQPALRCSASQTSPAPGGTVVYTASSVDTANITPLTWKGSDGTTGYGSGEQATRKFTGATTGQQYGMTVSKSGFTSANCPVVTIGSGGGTTCTDPELTLTANPTRVKPGDTTTLTYRATGVGSSWCMVQDPAGNILAPVPVNSCNAGPGTVETGPINAQTTFKLHCTGETDATVTVNVVPKFEEF